MSDLLKHKIELPLKERYPSRPLIDDGTAFTNAVPVSVVVPCAGYVTLYVRILTATGGGTLATRLRRTNTNEYPVGFSTADTAVVAGTDLQVAVPCKGAKEVIVRFTPSASGTFTYWDIGYEGY